jgi:YVTN family beta-propeller protein
MKVPPIFAVLVAFLVSSGCGGGSANIQAPPAPEISVSLSQTSATVQPQSTAQFSAAVRNDTAGKGVTWSMTCNGATCGSLSPTATASGTSTTYTAPQLPGVKLVVTLTATAVADTTKRASLAITVPAPTITVSVSQTSATVQPQATAQFTATVSNDSSGKGVTWSMTCNGASCGSVSSTATPSGAPTTYTAPGPPEGVTLMVTLTAQAVADTTKSASVAITVPPGPVAATVSGTIAVGTAPIAIAVDSTDNKIYVADFGTRPQETGTYHLCSPSGADVTAIDGATASTTSFATFGDGPEQSNPIAITLDNTSHTRNTAATVLVVLREWGVSLSGKGCSHYGDGVSEIDISTHIEYGDIYRWPDFSVTDLAGIDVNQITGSIYVAHHLLGNSNIVTVLGGSGGPYPVGTNPIGVAVNATTNKIFVANSGRNNISVIDVASGSVITITDPNAVGPVAVALNSTTNEIYVANSGSNNLTVIDGATDSVTATIPVGTGPFGVAVDPQTNFIYVANAGDSQNGNPGNITVINAATNATNTLADPKALNPIAVAVNSVTNKIYVANSGSNNVTVIDGAHD